MNLISGIVTAVTTVAETVVGAIAAAIAGPTLATVTTAVVTVGLVVGAGYLIYKGISKLLSKAEDYVDRKREEENIPARFKLDSKYDDDENEFESRRPDRSDSVAKKVHKVEISDRKVEDFFDDIRRSRNREYCDAIPGFYDPYGRFVPNSRFTVDYNFPTLTDDIYDRDIIDEKASKKSKKKGNRKRKKSKKYIDAEFTDVLDNMYSEIGTTKERAQTHLAILGLGPKPDTMCLT